MGVSKSALQSVNRYLARYLGKEGIRANLVSAGPLGTVAARSIPGFEQFENLWEIRAPLGWDPRDPEPVAMMSCVLMSDFAVATSGEVVHVDGGFHAVAAGETEGF
jgi:enoyl-[acyl-carrier protein] reductase I